MYSIFDKREHYRLECRPLSDQLNRGHDTSFSSVALWSYWAHSLLIIFINSAEDEAIRRPLECGSLVERR